MYICTCCKFILLSYYIYVQEATGMLQTIYVVNATVSKLNRRSYTSTNISLFSSDPPLQLSELV